MYTHPASVLTQYVHASCICTHSICTLILHL